MISLLTQNKLSECFWSYLVNTTSYDTFHETKGNICQYWPFMMLFQFHSTLLSQFAYKSLSIIKKIIFWFYFKFLTWKKNCTKFILLGIIKTSSWKLVFSNLFNLYLKSIFGTWGSVFISDIHCQEDPRKWLNLIILMQIKERTNLELITTGGHKEIPVGDHQWGSPVIEASSLENQTETMGVCNQRKGELNHGRQMKFGVKKVLQSRRNESFNFASLNEQGKIWEEGMKEEREKEKKGEERVLKLQ